MTIDDLNHHPGDPGLTFARSLSEERTVKLRLVLGIVALILAIISLFAVFPYLLTIAVILLATALVVGETT